MERKVVKALLALFLVVQLVIVAPAVPSMLSTDIVAASTAVTIRTVPQRGTMTQRDHMVAIANSQVQPGSFAANNRNPYSLEVRGRDGHHWCGDFLAWVLRRAGLTRYATFGTANGPYGNYRGWYFSSSQNWRVQHNNHGGSPFAPVAATQVQPGDIIVWQVGTAWSGHVAMVVAVHANTIDFVGGNQGGTVTRVNGANRTSPAWSGQNFRGYFRIRTLGTTPTPPPPTGNYFPRYTGNSVSIVDALNALGIDSSFNHRAQIAAVNNIPNYTGTAAQNTTMLNLLRAGTLRRP